ncbi:MAG: ABC transporter permease [Myxococcota bacterium]
MKRAPKRDWPTRIGALLVLTFALTAIVGPMIAPFEAGALDLAHAYEGPSALHLWGTGENGADLLSELLHGARLAGLVAFSVVGLSIAIGTTLGALAGYVGGALDAALGALLDTLQAFPSILLHVALLALLPNAGLGTLIAALALPGWVLYARIARAEALVLRRADYVLAAEALGARKARVLLRHVVPNLLGPVVILATTNVGGVVLAEAALSFLGLGPGGASWGRLLSDGSAALLRFPHLAMAAGAAIALTVLGFNLAGDGLRDRLAGQ